VVGLRLHRQILIGEFDRGIRGVVRIAEGISRLAGRDDGPGGLFVSLL